MNQHHVHPLAHTDPAVAEAIRLVMVEAYRVEAAILEVEDFVPLYRTASNIASTDAVFLGVTVGGMLAAAAEVERAGPLQVHIGALVVRPDHFRRGLATALLLHIMASHEEEAITVSTGAGNQPALLLYAARGFRERRRWETPDGIPMVTLERAPASQARPRGRENQGCETAPPQASHRGRNAAGRSARSRA